MQVNSSCVCMYDRYGAFMLRGSEKSFSTSYATLVIFRKLVGGGATGVLLLKGCVSFGSICVRVS